MRRSWRILVLGVAAIGVVATVSMGILYAQKEQPRSQTEKSAALYTIGVWEGQLAVFTGNNARPTTLFEVAVASLPPAEQQRLLGGIAVYSAGDLERLLEDYTS